MLAGLDAEPCAQGFAAALDRGGNAKEWKATVEEAMRSCPAAGLVLAAAVASPMLSPMGWPAMGVLLGDLGGQGKSTLLRVAASVFGSSGPAELAQPRGLVGRGDGTAKGILMQFRRQAHFPHLADEVKPSLHDPRKRDELADVLHQLFEGAKHVCARRSSDGATLGWAFPGCTVVAGEIAASEYLRKQGALRR